MINYGSTGAISFFLSIYLQTIKGISPQIAGLILITQPVIMVITAFISSRFTGRFDPRRVAAIGMAFTCVGLALLALLNQASPVISVIGGLIMVGIGFGLFISPNTEVVMSSVEKRYLGVASGVIGTMRSLGGMVAMGSAIILFSIYLGSAQIVPQYFPAFIASLRVAFIVFSILCFVGIFAQLAGSEAKAAIKAE
jgi:MFS family permease